MYKKFLEDAEEDYNEKMDDIRRYDNLLYKIKFELESRREDIQSMFGICLYDYWQWNTDEYDESDKMFNTLIAINSSIDVVNVEAKLLFQKFSRYFRILSKLHSLKSQCRRIKARKLISKDRFRDVLSRYYKQVSIEILEGRIYKFSNIFCLFFIVSFQSGILNKKMLIKLLRIMLNMKEYLIWFIKKCHIVVELY